MLTGIWRAKQHDDNQQWHWTWENRHLSKHPSFSISVHPHQQPWEHTETKPRNSHLANPQRTQHSYSSSNPETETGRSGANRSPEVPISRSWWSSDFDAGFWCSSMRFDGRGRCRRRVGCDRDRRPSCLCRGCIWRLQVIARLKMKMKMKVCEERGVKRGSRGIRVLGRWGKGWDVRVALETF